MRFVSALVLVILPVSMVLACHGARPMECQKLRQCCDAAQASGAEMETLRVQCTRKDDDDAVLCRRRLDDVLGLLPALADSDACRMPTAPLVFLPRPNSI